MYAVAVIAVIGATILVAAGLLTRSSSPQSDRQDASATTRAAPRPLQATGEIVSRATRSWEDVDDPHSDGWDTEAFHNRAKKQLKIVGKLLAHPEKIDSAQISELVTDEFFCTSLRPADTHTVMDDGDLKIERGSTDPGPSSVNPRPPTPGQDTFVAAIRTASVPFADATDVRTKFKLFRVDASPNEIKTRQYLEISGRTDTGMVEQHATWLIHWAAGKGAAPPRIRSIHVEQFEQVTSRHLKRTCPGEMIAEIVLQISKNGAS